MSLSNSRNFYAPVDSDKAVWLLETSAFFKKSDRLSSEGHEILAFGSHYSANFQPILDYFIPNIKLRCENSKVIKSDGVNTVVFNLHQTKRRAFLGHPVDLLQVYSQKTANKREPKLQQNRSDQRKRAGNKLVEV